MKASIKGVHQFGPHCKSGIYTLKVHGLDHIGKDLALFETLCA